MGLAVIVGPMVNALVEDIEYAEDLRSEFEAVNKALRKARLPAHNEPKALPELSSRASTISFPYSFLHYLRRTYAYHKHDPGTPPAPYVDGERPSQDPIIDLVATPKDHLLWHSDAEGFYVPIDFEMVIEDDDIPGLMLGSSYRLFRELVFVAPAIGVALEGDTLSDMEAERIEKIIEDEGPLYIELMVWILLYEAARLSIEYGTAIQFS